MRIENDHGEFVRVIEDGFVEQGRAAYDSPFAGYIEEIVTSRTPVRAITRTDVVIDEEFNRGIFCMYVISEPNGSRRIVEIPFDTYEIAAEQGARITNAAFQPVNY